MRSRGYTLVELMIVVAIISIIATIAIPNLLRSRMAANETAAAAACKAFAEAEEIYRRTDYNGDGVLEYAQNLSGTNSLLENSAGAGNVALIDRAFAYAGGAPLAITPKAGYCFAILTSQGIGAPGGARKFILASGSPSTSRLVLGYGLSAAPNQYDGSGRNTFVISNSGEIYQKDRGAATTAHETTFNPDGTWIAVPQ